MDDLTKLAAQRCAVAVNDKGWTLDDFIDGEGGSTCQALANYVLQAHHAAVMAKARLLAHIGFPQPAPKDAETIAALNALILTPPVDPVVDAVENALDGLGWCFDDTKQDMATDLISSLAKRGLELRSVGGGS